MVKDLTAGNPVRLILSFSLPMLLGNLFQQLYNTVDTFIVGRFLGKGALAAVGATGSVSFLVLGFVLGLSSGFSIPVAQAFGARDTARMRRLIGSTVSAAAGLAVLTTAASLLLTPFLLRLMNTPEDIYADSYAYIMTVFAGIAAIMFYNVLAGFLRAVGDSRTPLVFLVIASLLNVVLDLLFVVTLKLGVLGAGLATVASQLVSGLLCLIYIVRRVPALHISRADLMPRPENIRVLLGNGLPMALQFSITAIGSIVLQSSINSLGTDAVATVTAANRINNFLFAPLDTLGVAAATWCGQNRGAGRFDRVRSGVRDMTVIGLLYSAAVMPVMIFLGGAMVRLFIGASETAVIASSAEFLRIMAYFLPVLMLIYVFRNSLQGLGYGVPAMTAGGMELVARTLIALLLVPRFGIFAAYFASPIAWVAADLFLIPAFFVVMRRTHQRY